MGRLVWTPRTLMWGPTEPHYGTLLAVSMQPAPCTPNRTLTLSATPFDAPVRLISSADHVLWMSGHVHTPSRNHMHQQHHTLERQHHHHQTTQRSTRDPRPRSGWLCRTTDT